MCVCVCVRERERERERVKDEVFPHSLRLFTFQIEDGIVQLCGGREREREMLLFNAGS